MTSGTDGLGRLYKYRSLAGPLGRRTAEDVILHKRLFWQSPVHFNDPFDCRPNLIFGRTAIDRAAFMKRSMKSAVAMSMPRKERRSVVRKNLTKPPNEVERGLTAAFDRWMRQSAVTCFSALPDSALMWSHYADSHRGICFIFQEILSETPFVSFDVAYSEKRPEVDLTRMNSEDTLELAILTKSDDWSYEQEKRMIDYRGQPGYRPFPRDALIGIILGLDISESDSQFVQSLVSRSASKLQIFQTSISRTSFRLDINPLNSDQ